MLREFKGKNQYRAKPIISGKVIFHFRITLFIFIITQVSLYVKNLKFKKLKIRLSAHR